MERVPEGRVRRVRPLRLFALRVWLHAVGVAARFGAVTLLALLRLLGVGLVRVSLAVFAFVHADARHVIVLHPDVCAGTIHGPPIESGRVYRIRSTVTARTGRPADAATLL